jgi:hypothetical protein
MKYIIKESKLDMLIADYLNSWVDTKSVSRHDKFIVFHQEAGWDEWDDVMEYDGSDGRLWVHRDFLNLVTDIFGKNKVEMMTFIGRWFEDKFGVEVNIVE